MIVRAIRKDDLETFLDFFDNRGFKDNPDWNFCYCNCFYADHCEKVWTDRTASENRAATVRRIKEGAMHGYIALDCDRVVGWCGAGPMKSIPAFAGDEDPEIDKIGVITCFLVDPDRRGQGIARALLREVCADFRESGLSIAEANPRPNALTDADLHFGPLKLFESEGFVFYREDPEDGSIYVRRYFNSE